MNATESEKHLWWNTVFHASMSVFILIISYFVMSVFAQSIANILDFSLFFAVFAFAFYLCLLVPGIFFFSSNTKYVVIVFVSVMLIIELSDALLTYANLERGFARYIVYYTVMTAVFIFACKYYYNNRR